MSPLSEETLLPFLHTYYMGRHAYFLGQTGSTNDLARGGALVGQADGTIWVADEQMSGRGRLGRNWSAPAGTSLLCSILLYPRFNPSLAYYLTIVAAISIRAAIEQVTGVVTGIKWPNDIYYQGRKLGGILSETEFEGHNLHFAVVGWGLNVNFDPVLFPEIAATATSLSSMTGQQLDRAELLAAVLNQFEIFYSMLEREERKSIFNRWRDALSMLGQPVVISNIVGPAGETFEGIARDVDEDGALLVETREGLRRVFAGDVTLRAHG